MISQSRFPRLWLAFQKMFDQDKHRFIRERYEGQPLVLEVGCSAGNVSALFQEIPCEFLGIDIDDAVIRFAKRRFSAFKHMAFKTENLMNIDRSDASFDLIIFIGMCHHVEDRELTKLLQKAGTLLNPDGKIIVADLIIGEKSSWLEKFLLRADAGDFIRTQASLREIVAHTTGLRIVSQENDAIRMSLIRWPQLTQFVIFNLSPESRTGVS